MRWFSAVVVTGLLLAAATLPHAVAAPSATIHGLAVPPVPGTVQREFIPPPSRYAAGHRGVDLAASPGEPVVAAMGGVVTFSGTVALVGWVTVDHGGELTTTYGPVEPRAVAPGQRVERGSLLGFVAPAAGHLDWGARLEGEYIDPLALLQQWEAYLTTDSGSGDRALLAAAAGAGGPMAGVATRGSGRLLRPVQGPVTSSFGPRHHPVSGEHRLHAGVDFGAPTGAPVQAAEAGVVTFAGEASGYGRTVIVDHDGGLSTLYAHLSAVDVVVGQLVSAGSHIGAVGATGLVTGPHLHFEVRTNGVAQDPATWL